MTFHLVTFSDESMSRSRDLCAESAWDPGGLRPADIHVFLPEDIKEHFYTPHYQVYTQNRQVFDATRGCGYWAWKPLFLYYHMFRYWFGPVVKEGDIIIYADAGIEFIAPVSHIIDRMDQDIFLFGNNWEHAHWCKRDVIEEVWPTFANAPMDRPWNAVADSATWLRFGKQVQASVIFFRVSDYTRKFVKEWLDWCLFEGGRLIDDSPSRLPNHPEFREHRHDQAILTTMAYREGIKLHYWPATYNDGAFNYEKLHCYAGDNYPILFHHHRRRNHEWENAA